MPKGKFVSFRVTHEELEIIDSLVSSSGFSNRGEYLRSVALNHSPANLSTENITLYDVQCELLNRIEELENKIVSRISTQKDTVSHNVSRSSVDVSRSVTRPSNNKFNGGSDNSKRAKEAKLKVFKLLDGLMSNKQIPTYRGDISQTELSRLSGIDKGTFRKYLPEWKDKNADWSDSAIKS